MATSKEVALRIGSQRVRGSAARDCKAVYVEGTLPGDDAALLCCTIAELERGQRCATCAGMGAALVGGLVVGERALVADRDEVQPLLGSAGDAEPVHPCAEAGGSPQVFIALQAELLPLALQIHLQQIHCRTNRLRTGGHRQAEYRDGAVLSHFGQTPDGQVGWRGGEGRWVQVFVMV